MRISAIGAPAQNDTIIVVSCLFVAKDIYNPSQACEPARPAVAILKRAAGLYCIFAIKEGTKFSNAIFWGLSRCVYGTTFAFTTSQSNPVDPQK
jgi:hypothetical protein